MSSIQSLNASFAVNDALTFDAGPGGLVRAQINTPACQGTIYLHGAHIAHYQPAGQAPVLFMSKQSAFEAGKPIRGGVPVIFPWFGPRASDPASPMHGFARLSEWTVESTRKHGDDVSITLALEPTAQSQALWPHAFSLKLQATFGPKLRITLAATNRSAAPLQFEEALHTYFAVGDVREASVSGLAGVEYIDKADAMKRKTQDPQPIRITGETDRVYVSTKATCVIDDPKLGRRIVVEKSGSDATVVWNPWIAKAKAMADFGDDEWPGMICVETVNAGQNAITLAPGQTHEMAAVIFTQPR